MNEINEASKASLWEILVPTVRNDKRPFRLRHHKVWDAKVRTIAGGLTIVQPVKGEWLATDDTLFQERMIPVRIMCGSAAIEQIADFTAKHYDQLAVLYYKITDEVFIKHYG